MKRAHMAKALGALAVPPIALVGRFTITLNTRVSFGFYRTRMPRGPIRRGLICKTGSE